MLQDLLDFHGMIQDLLRTLPGQNKAAWREQAATLLRSSLHDRQLHRDLDAEIPFKHRGPILTGLERLQSDVNDYRLDKDPAITANLRRIATAISEILASKKGIWVYTRPGDDQDPLLLLASRKTYDQDKTAAHDEATATEPLAALFVDIDHFKQVNDTMGGHKAGDTVLKTIATSIKTTIGPTGKAYRYGGEELLALLPNTTSHQALATAERLRENIKATRIPGLGRPVTVSVGVAVHPAPDKTGTPDDLVDLADQRMYQAKQAGRDRVEGPESPPAPPPPQPGAPQSAPQALQSAGDLDVRTIDDAWQRSQVLIGDLGQLTRIDRHYPHVLHEPPDKIRQILEAEGYSSAEVEEVVHDASPDRAIVWVADRRRYHDTRASIRDFRNDLVLRRPGYPEDLWNRFTELIKALHRVLVKVSFALQGDENKRHEADDLLSSIDNKDVPALSAAIRRYRGLTTAPSVSLGEVSGTRLRVLVYLARDFPRAYTAKTIAFNIGEESGFVLEALEFLRDHDLVTYRDVPDGQRYAASPAGRQLAQDNHLF